MVANLTKIPMPAAPTVKPAGAEEVPPMPESSPIDLSSVTDDELIAEVQKRGLKA